MQIKFLKEILVFRHFQYWARSSGPILLWILMKMSIIVLSKDSLLLKCHFCSESLPEPNLDLNQTPPHIAIFPNYFTAKTTFSLASSFWELCVTMLYSPAVLASLVACCHPSLAFQLAGQQQLYSQESSVSFQLHNSTPIFFPPHLTRLQNSFRSANSCFLLNFPIPPPFLSLRGVDGRPVL